MIKHFYCPECHKTYSVNMECIVKKTDNKLVYDIFCFYKCDCGSDASEIDENLIYSIPLLNRIKLKTVYCCEGHVYIKNEDTLKEVVYPYIILSSTDEFMKIVNRFGLPEKWAYEPTTYNDNCSGIRLFVESFEKMDFENIRFREFTCIRNEYINNLNKWVNKIYGYIL